jgi:hypothetical protein
MKLGTLAIALSLVAVSACGKKAEDKPAPVDKTAPAPAPAAAPVAAAAATMPVATNPKDLYAEFTKSGADTMALINKYEAGATFTGTIVNAAKEMTDQPVIYFDIDGTHKMSAKFADPASVKMAKVGDTMTVTCKIGGADDKIMMVTDCVKK